MRNAFIALSELATRENWCWRITCTTCGCHDFRYGFKALMQGLHPDHANWPVRKRQRRRLSHTLGPIPWRRGSPTIEEQQELLAILSDVSVTQLLAVTRFPDWLGHLGLAMYFSQAAEAKDRALTKALVPQLIAILQPRESEHRTSLVEYLTEIEQRGVLKWTDLEQFERGYLSSG